jgi:hypothetical protein
LWGVLQARRRLREPYTIVDGAPFFLGPSLRIEARIG